MKFSAINPLFDTGESEDSWVVVEKDDRILCAAVADGVGSFSGGGAASRIAIEVVSRAIHAMPDVSNMMMFRKVRDALKAGPKDIRLGTTLTTIVFRGAEAYVGHVGDCRVYHVRGDGIVTRTKDQTEAQHLVDQGVLTPAKAKSYPRANVLLSVMAPEREYELYENVFEIKRGDRVLICSDGFYRIFSKREIVDVSVAAGSFEEFVNNIASELADKTLIDDTTCIAIEV